MVSHPTGEIVLLSVEVVLILLVMDNGLSPGGPPTGEIVLISS